MTTARNQEQDPRVPQRWRPVGADHWPMSTCPMCGFDIFDPEHDAHHEATMGEPTAPDAPSSPSKAP